MTVEGNMLHGHKKLRNHEIREFGIKPFADGMERIPDIARHKICHKILQSAFIGIWAHDSTGNFRAFIQNILHLAPLYPFAKDHHLLIFPMKESEIAVGQFIMENSFFLF